MLWTASSRRENFAGRVATAGASSIGGCQGAGRRARLPRSFSFAADRQKARRTGLILEVFESRNGGVFGTASWRRTAGLAARSSIYNAGRDQPPVKLVAGPRTVPSVAPDRPPAHVRLLHDHPRRKSLALVQRVEPAFDRRPRDAGRLQLGNSPAIQRRSSTASSPTIVFRRFRARAMRSARSRLLFTEAARQNFGRTTGTSRPRSSRMIECTACLRDPVAQLA